jgi:hypothetical protein
LTEAATAAFPQLRHSAPLPKGTTVCPECKLANKRRVKFANPKELGKHRRFVHLVVGQKHETHRYRMARKAAAASFTSPQLTVLPPKEPNIASSQEDNRHAIPNEAYAVIVGSILKEIRTYADTHGFIARDFTAGVVNYLRGAALR